MDKFNSSQGTCEERVQKRETNLLNIVITEKERALQHSKR